MRSVYKTHPVHGKCLFIDNGYLEVGIALEFGIRIVHFSFLDGENVFYEQPADSHAFETPEGWRLRGGHRLWLTPEDKNTYFPDNLPVDHELGNNSVLITQSEDSWLGLLKSVEITLHPKCAEVKHIIKNTSKSPRTTSLWGVSVMKPGGVEKIPLPTVPEGGEPLFNLAMWGHSSLADERITFGKENLTLTWQDLEKSLKIGIAHPTADVCYERGNIAFYVNYTVQKDAKYSHSGVSYETFFSKYMVEVETLSPAVTLAYGESAEHTEFWRLEKI